MNKRFKCILFDLDGTLLSTGGAGIRALDRAFFELHGLEKSLDRIDPAGKTDPAIIREIFRLKLGRPCAADEMEAVQQRYLQHLPVECRTADDYKIMEGIPKILEHIQSLDLAVGLGTGNIESGARKKLDRSGLNKYFPFGGFGSDSEDRPELLKIGHAKACVHSGRDIPKEDVFIIGDTHLDISAARKAGFKVIAVATGNFTVDFLKSHNPDHVLPNFENLEEFVGIILNGN